MSRESALVATCDNCGRITKNPHRDNWIQFCLRRPALNDSTECGGPMYDACSNNCAVALVGNNTDIEES